MLVLQVTCPQVRHPESLQQMKQLCGSPHLSSQLAVSCADLNHNTWCYGVRGNGGLVGCSNSRLASNGKVRTNGKIGSNYRLHSNGKSRSNGRLGSNGQVGSNGRLPSNGKIPGNMRMGSRRKLQSNGKIRSNGKLGSNGSLVGGRVGSLECQMSCCTEGCGEVQANHVSPSFKSPNRWDTRLTTSVPSQRAPLCQSFTTETMISMDSSSSSSSGEEEDEERREWKEDTLEQRVRTPRLVRTSVFSSQTDLPTYLQGEVSLAHLPREKGKEEEEEGKEDGKEEEEGCMLMEYRRNGITMGKEEFYAEAVWVTDSDSDRFSDGEYCDMDMEKGNATEAAWTVVTIFLVFFFCMAFILTWTMFVLGDYQVSVHLSNPSSPPGP